MNSILILILIFSIYSLFITKNALKNGVALLRVGLVVLGIVVINFDQELVITSFSFLYVILAIAMMAISRSEVQIKK